ADLGGFFIPLGRKFCTIHPSSQKGSGAIAHLHHIQNSSEQSSLLFSAVHYFLDGFGTKKEFTGQSVDIHTLPKLGAYLAVAPVQFPAGATALTPAGALTFLYGNIQQLARGILLQLSDEAGR